MLSGSMHPVSFALLALASLGCAAAPLNAMSTTPRAAAVQTAPPVCGAASIASVQAEGAATTQPAVNKEIETTMARYLAASVDPSGPSPISSHSVPKSTAGGASVGVIRTLFGGRGIEGKAIPAPPPRLLGEHELSAPIREESMVAHGSIAPDVIQRVVRQGLGQAQACYEYGRMRDPNLAGTVRVAFVIGGSGTVWRAKATEDSDLADPTVVTCIEQSFYLLSFPKPENGMLVGVTYPLAFGPKAEPVAR